MRQRLPPAARQPLHLLLLATVLLAACSPAPDGSAEAHSVEVVPTAPEPSGAAGSTGESADSQLVADFEATLLAGPVGVVPGEATDPGHLSEPLADLSAPVHGPAETPCDSSGSGLPPLGPEVRRSFREPLPSTPLWNPPGQKRVGLQVGHWQVEQTPGELSRLQHGTSGGGREEWEVNLDIAQRTRLLLEAAGVQVDLLPATVPMRYRAHAFISIHADGDPTGQLSGFKIARPGFSSIPAEDDQLVTALNEVYASVTRLPRDDEHISMRMRYYYAFNSRRYCHAVAPGVPQAIVETGFLTSAADRGLLLGNPDLVARGIAEGIVAFLNTLPDA
jgi:N-acetylmuramoyl-L-alanine amidase